MAEITADFSGYATKHGLKCSDGRTIMPGAFKHHDKQTVPLVWSHQHNNPDNVLGHAVLEDREDGVYAMGFFNETPAGQNTKALVKHGDITNLSIYANQLVQRGDNVMHGEIREVSLVLAGANPGAVIDNVNLMHSDGTEFLEDEAILFTGEPLQHSGEESDEKDEEDGEEKEQTVEDIFNELTDKQKDAVYYIVDQAVAAKTSEEGDSDDSSDDSSDSDTSTGGDLAQSGLNNGQEGSDMTRNLFDQTGGTDAPKRATLSHDQLTTIVEDAKRSGSLKDSFMKHAVEYGIENLELLFPDAKAIDNIPELIGRQTEWVSGVLNGARKSPFSRIKSLSADITHDEARAKGYIKGTLKKEEWFGLSQRVTTPTTIYKKQKLDRDDIIDITTIDVVAWLKGEMRLMLNEEIARAMLVGDGREVDDEDKIRDPAALADGAGIRSIAYDDDFYSHKVVVPAGADPETLVEQILRSRRHYKGTGNPTMYCVEDLLTDLLLSKDKMGRRHYGTQAELQSALRVSNIVTVPVMESRSVNGGDLLAILVNMSDYTVGTDRGGEVSMFDDFDIDYNQYKYLIEGRMSGTLTKHKSAMVFTRGSGTLVAPQVPSFNSSTGVVTIPNQTGVTYRNEDTDAVLTAGAQTALAPGASLNVVATPASGFYFAENTDATHTYTRPQA